MIITGLIPMIYFTYFNYPYMRYNITLESKDGTELSGWLYLPSPAPSSAAPIPGIVVTHGFTSSKVSMQGYSIEFVKRGFVVVAIDYRGHGMSDGYLDSRRYTNESPLIDDIMAGVKYLRNLNYVDKKSIAILGHSMGGITAIQAGAMYPDEINATISIGAILNPDHGEGTVNVSLISNFMIGIGGHEELFTIEAGLNFMKNYTGITDPKPNTLYGNFTYGNATELVVSPSSDHILEISDKNLIESSVEWLENAFYGGVRYPITITEKYRSVAMLTTLLGVLISIFSIVAYSRKAFFKSKPLIYDIQEISSEIELSPARSNTEKMKVIVFYALLYISGTSFGLLLEIPFSYIFESTVLKVMSSLFIAIFLGLACGLFLIYFLIHRFFEHKKTPLLLTIYNRLTRNFRKSTSMGLIIFFYLFSFLVLTFQIGALNVVLTIRDLGAFIAIGLLIAPYFLISELLIRQFQDKLNIKNRFTNWIITSVIISLIKISVFIPLLFMGLGFVTLMIAILVGLLPVMEIFSNWTYIYSDRNPLTPAIFSWLFMTWFLTFLMPFGTITYSLF